MSHELRTPLASLKALTETLKRRSCRPRKRVHVFWIDSH
ncbi:MAG: hypothetical protein IPJ31_11895 [Bacteroidetes bacterium]|nr:hypothetical protein [Bacteroidota bacterium]